MGTVGVIFLSLGATPELRELTQQAVDSCIASDKDVNFKILVCEGVEGVKYNGAWVTHPPRNKPFNYNEYFNICRVHPLFDACTYFALCNNDLVFEKGWASSLIEKMKEHKVLSACPMDPRIHPEVKFTDGVSKGHQVTAGDRHVAGWCIFQHKDIYSVIENLTTECEFWHSDVMYAAQLMNHSLEHILVEDSKVHHLTSRTLNSSAVSESTRYYYTEGSPIHKKIYGNIS